MPTLSLKLSKAKYLTVLLHIFNSALSFFAVLLISRHLPIEKFGEFAYYKNLIDLGIGIVSLGVYKVVIREIVKEKHYNWTPLIIVRLIIVFIATLFIISYVENMNYKIILILFLLLSIFDNNFILDAKKKFFRLTLNTTVRYLTFFIFIIYFFYISQEKVSNYDIVLFLMFSYLLGYFLYVVIHNLQIKDLYFLKPISIKDLAYFFHSSKYLIFSFIIALLYSRIDLIMLEKLSSSYEMGVYGIGNIFYQMFLIISGVISRFIFIDGLESKDIELYKQSKDKFTKFFVIGVVFLFMYLIIPKSFIFTILNKNYSNYIVYTILFSIVLGILHFSGAVFGQYLLVLNKDREFLYINIAVSFLNILFNFILIPFYGAIGAILGSILCVLVGTTISFIYFKSFNNRLKVNNEKF